MITATSYALRANLPWLFSLRTQTPLFEHHSHTNCTVCTLFQCGNNKFDFSYTLSKVQCNNQQTLYIPVDDMKYKPFFQYLFFLLLEAIACFPPISLSLSSSLAVVLFYYEHFSDTPLYNESTVYGHALHTYYHSFGTFRRISRTVWVRLFIIENR